MRSSFDLMSEVVAMCAMGFEEEFRPPGQPVIEPQRFAASLNLKLPDLMHLAGVHPATVTEAPENVALQGFMREALRVAWYYMQKPRRRHFITHFRSHYIPATPLARLRLPRSDGTAIDPRIDIWLFSPSNTRIPRRAGGATHTECHYKANEPVLSVMST